MRIRVGELRCVSGRGSQPRPISTRPTMIPATPASCLRVRCSPKSKIPPTSGMTGYTLDTAAVTATWPTWPPLENASNPTASVSPAAAAQATPDALPFLGARRANSGRTSSSTVTEAPCAITAAGSHPALEEYLPRRNPPKPYDSAQAMASGTPAVDRLRILDGAGATPTIGSPTATGGASAVAGEWAEAMATPATASATPTVP